MNNKQIIYSYDELTSTMDKAKELIKSNEIQSSFFSVLANCQSNGRGTNGRSWISLRGNLLITICFKIKDLPISMTLIPLRIGHILCCAIEDILQTHESYAQVDIKWPNDVLIENKKMCGVLIEMENDMLVVGIGCNLITTPIIDKTGSEAGRDATCLQDHLDPSKVISNLNSDSNVDDLYYLRDVLASNILTRISNWYEDKIDTNEQVIEDCSRKMTYLPQRLRLERVTGLNRQQIQSFMGIGDEVRPIQLNHDGTLQVIHVETNRQLTLASEYLW